MVLFMVAAALLAAPTLVGQGRAQAYLPEDNLAYPVQVVVPGAGGTGFFVRRDRELFLVTARHVLFDMLTGQLHSSEFTLRALSKDVKEAAVTVMHVNPVVQLSRTNKLRIIGIATQFVPEPEDVLGAKPGDSTMMALGNSGYGVVASADSIIELISAF